MLWSRILNDKLYILYINNINNNNNIFQAFRWETSDMILVSTVARKLPETRVRVEVLL